MAKGAQGEYENVLALPAKKYYAAQHPDSILGAAGRLRPIHRPLP